MMKEMKAKVEGGQDSQEDEEDDAAKPEDELKEILEEFLTSDALPGLDDHHDSTINPLMMYQIKKAKEQVRRQKAIDQLIKAQNYEEGFIEGLSQKEREQLEKPGRRDPPPRRGDRERGR